MEAELVAMGELIKIVIWLRLWAFEVGNPQAGPTIIFHDNKSAIDLSQNPVFHSRSRHYRVQQDFIQQHVTIGTVKIVKVPSKFNVADLYTKSLQNPAFSRHGRRVQGY